MDTCKGYKMTNKRMALATANDIIVIPQELWVMLIDVLQLSQKDCELNDTKLWYKLGVVGYLFGEWEKEIIDSQQLYMTAHPNGYEQWETEVVNNAISRLQDELKVLCNIKINMKGITQ